jgi:hypothetical protein
MIKKATLVQFPIAEEVRPPCKNCSINDGSAIIIIALELY